MNDFEEKQSVGKKPKIGLQRIAGSAKSITAAKENVQNKYGQEIDLQGIILVTILHKDLHLLPYKTNRS